MISRPSASGRPPWWRRIACALLSLPAAISGARAEDTPATELAGLFMQGCVPFAGSPAQLRAWAATIPLRSVPDPARAVFLHGAPGQAFDATSPLGKFVLTSSDDGLCSAVTDRVAGPAVHVALENALRTAGFTFQLAIERNDKAAANLPYREYFAARDGLRWRILAATVTDPKGGQAMLTAGPGL